MADIYINKAAVGGAQKWVTLAGKERLDRTVAALRDRGIQAEISTNRANGLARLHELIPAGSSLMTGASATLKEIGFESELMAGNHPWNWLKPAILAEKDPERQAGLRRQSSNSDCFVGSVQAVTEAGEIVVASGSGSQIAAYAYSSPRVIWVVGGQKIVADLESAFRRHAALHSQGIQVKSEDGKVTLEGTVGSWSAPGVTQVENKLLIQDRKA